MGTIQDPYFFSPELTDIIHEEYIQSGLIQWQFFFNTAVSANGPYMKVFSFYHEIIFKSDFCLDFPDVFFREPRNNPVYQCIVEMAVGIDPVFKIRA